MAVPVIQTSFAAGEIAPSLWGHVDLTRFRSAASTLRNMFVGYRGGAYSRAGTAYIGRSKQSPAHGDAAPRLISFTFSITQTYVLEFGTNYIRFIFQGGYVVEAAVAITGAARSNPCQITAPAHGYANGNWVQLNAISGMTQLNGNTYIVSGATTNTFTLDDLDGNPVDASAFGVYAGGGTAERIYELSTPYAGADLQALKFDQSADVISLTHPNYPPYDLARLSATAWSLTPTNFGSAIAAPGSATATATTHPSGASSPPTLPCAFAYVVTAVDPKTGQESIASPVANVTNSVDIAATAGSIQVKWAPVVGAQNYNVYKAPASYNTQPGNTANALPVPVGAMFGLVGSAFGTEFDDSNVSANMSISPPQHRNPFAPGQVVAVAMGTSSNTWTTATVSITTATGSGFVGACVISGGAVVAVIVLDPGQNYAATDTVVFSGDGTASATLNVGPTTGTYPSIVSYFQQRRFYAASLNLPDTYWASQPGAFTNFDTSIPVNDADAITGTPWAQQVDGIVWMISMPLGMVTFTGNGVWQLGGPGSFASNPSAITPSNQMAAPQSSIGASAVVQPAKINWDILYLDSYSSTVRDLTYQLYFNVYTGTDISWQSSHLLVGRTIPTNWAWANVPNRVLWMVRDDGVLLSLTYLKEQEVAGWARHDTLGQFRGVCAVAELPVDAVYLVAERPVAGGGTRFFIERMNNRIWSGVEDCWCVDAGLTLPLTRPAATLNASAGSGNGVTFTASASVFSVGNVGQVLRMGGGIALVTSNPGPTSVVGNWLFPCQDILPNDPDSTPVQQASGNWSIAPQVTTVSGLGHLVGRTVTGVADGVPIPPTVVPANGTITLSVPASLVTVGLGFAAQLQSVYLDTGAPTIQGRRKAISAVTVRVEGSGSLQAGANQADASASSPSPSFATWVLPPAVVSADAPKTYATAGGATVQPLFTGDVRALVPADWRKPGQVAVQQLLPLPLNVLDLVPEILPGDTPEVEMPPQQRGRPQQQQRAG